MYNEMVKLYLIEKIHPPLYTVILVSITLSKNKPPIISAAIHGIGPKKVYVVFLHHGQ